MRWTAAGMWWEALARAFWPAFALAVATLAGVALGLVPPRAGLGGGLAGAVLLALPGLWRLRRPRAEAVADRVDARMPGRPLATLADVQAAGAADAGSVGLWQAHRARAAAAAARARPVRPAAGLARRDRYGLRLMALTAAAMGLLFGSAAPLGQGIAAIAATFRPMREAGPAASGAGWEGWAAPPEYTARPVIYLNELPEGATLSLPQGSRITLRLYGGAGFVQDVGTLSGAPDAPEIAAARSGTLSVGGRSFPVTVQPDAPPQIAAGAAPQRRADGRLVQGFTAADDNGIAHASAEIALDLGAVDRRYGLAIAPEPREAIRLDLPLPVRGSRTEVAGNLTADLSRHPFANLPVILTLRAEDGIAQTASAPPMRMILPGRRFFDPLAAALIELRRDLLWSRENAPRSAQLLRAITWNPSDGSISEPLLGELRGAVTLLEAGSLTAETRDRLAEALWAAAIRLEDGGLEDARARMAAAQERLAEAIRGGASPDEVRRLMDELKAATDAYTDMLAEQGAADEQGPKFTRDQPGQRITGDQIQKMMDEIERLMNEGRMAEAQELLDQLGRLMESLKVTRGEGGDSGRPGGTGAAQDQLAETLRQQQRLADEALREGQGNAPQPGAPGTGAEGRPGDGEGGDGAGSADGQAPPPGAGGDLASRQRALRRELGQQRGMLPGPGTGEGEAARRELDRAGRAMEEAEQALRDGDGFGALDRQAEAIEALREGLRALGRLGDGGGEGEGRQQGEAQAPGDAPEGPAGDGREARGGAPVLPQPPTDPLGRALSGDGRSITTGEAMAEGGADPNARARDLLGEIRRRLGDPGRAAPERDYLGRLLDRF